MTRQASIALAAGLLMAGVPLAAAAAMQPSAAPTTANLPAAGTKLNLTSKQQKMAWNDLHNRATKQTEPSGFDGAVGAVVPGSIGIKPVSNKAASDVPALRPYDFAMVQCGLLIVTPANRKIVDVDHHPACTRSSTDGDLGG